MTNKRLKDSKKKRSDEPTRREFLEVTAAGTISVLSGCPGDSSPADSGPLDDDADKTGTKDSDLTSVPDSDHDRQTVADMSDAADGSVEDAGGDAGRDVGSEDEDASGDAGRDVGGDTFDADTWERRPNILVFLFDDLGYGDLGSFGAQWVQTPRLDALAEESVRFTRFYVPSPVCSPSRASFLTGRVPDRHGQTRVLASEEMKMGPGETQGETFLAEPLRDAGYATGAFGKWQLGFGADGHPNDRGFDYFYGSPGGGVYWFDDDPNDPSARLYENRTEVDHRGYSPTLHTDALLSFIDQHSDQPFFAYIGLVAPHTPWASSIGKPWAPQEFIDLYPGTADQPVRQNYKASISATDHEIGRVLDRLDALGIADDTIIIVYSDNGGGDGSDNGPLRGGKRDLYEGGIRVPSLVRWPKRFAPALSDVPLTSMDLFSLALSIAGASPPTDVVIDGRDPTVVLEGSAAMPARDLYFHYSLSDPAEALVRDQFKLVGNQLFDVVSDPGETTDIAGTNAALFEEMRRALEAWRAELGL